MKTPSNTPTPQQTSEIAQIMDDPNAKAMARDFIRLMQERVQTPRDRILDLVDNAHIEAMLLTDDILEAGMTLIATVMDRETGDRLAKDAALSNDRHTAAMNEIELLMHLRAFLAGVIVVKAQRGDVSLIDMGLVAARVQAAKFMLT